MVRFLGVLLESRRQSKDILNLAGSVRNRLFSHIYRWFSFFGCLTVLDHFALFIYSPARLVTGIWSASYAFHIKYIKRW